MIVRKCLKITLTPLILFLSGCATSPPPQEQVPADEVGVGVSSFSYIPAARDWEGVPPTYIPAPEDMEVNSNEILNTGIGNILLTRDVESLYKEIVVNELRLAGVELEGHGLSLGGEIQTLYIEEHDKTIDWVLRATYVMKTNAGGVRFRMSNASQRQTVKEIDFEEAVKRLIEVNVRQILQDEGFRRASSNCCDSPVP